MKYLRSDIVTGLLLCFSNLVFAQDMKSSVQFIPEQVGMSVVDALKNRDVVMLMGLITEAGITVGTDGSTIPVATFKRELQQKRGVYCVLMDGACIKGAGKNTEDGSLRGLILRGPVKLDVHSVGGAPKIVEVVVRKETESSRGPVQPVSEE